MNKMKKLCLLLLCLGVVGGTAACDMSMLGGMLGGSSVESGVESTEGESSSTDNTETSEIPDGSDMQDAWEDATKEENFNNVTFAYSVVFKGETEVNTGTAYLDGDKAACIEGDGDLELMDKEETEALRNVYVKTVLAVLDNFTSFTYDFVTNTFVSTAEIVYTVNVMGMEAKITANGVRVWFDGDGNVSAISCDMKHEFRENGVNKALEMRTEFTFTDYGKTVVDIENGGENPDGGEEVLTKAQWDAAFEATANATNKTIYMGSTFIESGRINALKQLTTDGITSITQTFTSGEIVSEETRYFEMGEDKSYYYLMENEEWAKYEATEEVLAWLAKNDRRLTLFQPLYDQVTYDAEAKMFVAENVTLAAIDGDETLLTKVTVSFRNGKLYEITYETEEEKDGYFRVEDYGTTETELPKEYRDETKPQDSTDEAAWNAAFEATYATSNVTMKVWREDEYLDPNHEPYSMEHTHKYDYDKLESIQTFLNQTVYYAKEGEKVFAYNKKDGVWTKEEVSYEVGFNLEAAREIFSPVQVQYDAFTYDETRGCYVAKDFTLINPSNREETYSEFRVRIVDGYIVEFGGDGIMMKDGEVYGTAHVMYSFSDYGTTKVELPKIEDAELTDEEAWHAAFEKTLAVDNFSIAVETYRDFTIPNQVDGAIFYTQKITQNTFESVQSFLHQTVYYEKNEEGSLEYTLKNGEWVTKQYGPERIQYTSESLVANVKPYEALYAQMTYDEYTGWYVAENVTLAINGNESYCYKVGIRIDNGYVVGIEVETMITSDEEDVGKAYLKLSLFDFNTTVVELPTAPTDKQVTENEWVSALNTAVNTNNVTASMIYTFEYTDGQENEFTFSKMMLTENATYQWGSNSGRPYQQYYAKLDGVDYSYKLNEGKWSKSELGQEATYTNYRMASVFDPMVPLYETFTYDASKGLYTCAEIMLDAGNGRMQAIYNVQIGFEDGKVTYFYYEMDLTDSDGVKNGVAKIHVTLGDYGTTDFELPNV